MKSQNPHVSWHGGFFVMLRKFKFKCKWQNRDSAEHKSHRPRIMHTTLADAQEAIVIALRARSPTSSKKSRIVRASRASTLTSDTS
jgi:hypothetical protein